jgi:hypothetical protein
MEGIKELGTDKLIGGGAIHDLLLAPAEGFVKGVAGRLKVWI